MLTVENLSKSYGDKVLFNNISFTIESGDRIGLIGVNGSGKSTLLKTVAGIETAETGEIKHAKQYRIEYLEQEPVLDPKLTVIEEIYYGDSDIMALMRAYEQILLDLAENPENESLQTNLLQLQQKMDEKDAWEANAQAKTILTKLGITTFNKKIADLSGGQRKRVAIAKALIQPADLLILDEPTNHLDNQTVEWLEKHLQTYKGALLLVTHDRYFLNRVTNRIYELERGHLYSYDGNYELFLEKKAAHEEQELAEESKHKNVLRRELAWLKRGARARSTKQKARIDRISDMQEKEFQTINEQLTIQIGSARLGKQVLEAKNLTKSYGENVYIKDFSELVIPGDRIGIIGPNGSGKTTLLNLLAGRITPDSGVVEVGETVKIGYYTQGDAELDGAQRLIDYIKETAEVIYTADGSPITAVQMAEQFLFPRSEQYTYIRKLSGGEKRRLYLLKILMEEPNVLFLDEPTNDLDTQTLSVLEEYLEHFPGVVITVSHDRYFLDRVVDRLIVFEGQGEITRFYGNYSDYLEKQITPIIKEETHVKKPVRTNKPKKLSYNEQREWETIEDDIMELEEAAEALESQIAEAGSDTEKVQVAYEKLEKVREDIDVKMDRWEELSQKIEAFEKQ